MIVDITGTGFSPIQPVTFSVGNQMFAPTVYSDSNGDLQVNGTVPDLPHGTAYVVAHDVSGVTCQAPIYVYSVQINGTGAPSPTPSSYYPTVPIPTPSVPEFTVKYVNSSYEVPTSYSINPYTGQNVTNPSYYIDNESIVLTISNQPFTSFIDNINGAPWNISLFYDVREKGHYAENWTNLYYTGYFPIKASSQYTVLTYPAQHYSNAPDSYMLGDISVQIPEGGQIDIQVEALIGYISPGHNFPPIPTTFAGQTSDWSNTQSITVPSTSSSPSPTVPEFSSLAILLLLLSLFFVAVVIRHRKPNNLNQ